MYTKAKYKKVSLPCYVGDEFLQILGRFLKITGVYDYLYDLQKGQGWLAKKRGQASAERSG